MEPTWPRKVQSSIICICLPPVVQRLRGLEEDGGDDEGLAVWRAVGGAAAGSHKEAQQRGRSGEESRGGTTARALVRRWRLARLRGVEGGGPAVECGDGEESFGPSAAGTGIR